MWRCPFFTGTFFGHNPKNPREKIILEEELNFLVFFGKFSRTEAKKMPTWKRKWNIEKTLENLKLVYGTND